MLFDRPKNESQAIAGVAETALKELDIPEDSPLRSALLKQTSRRVLARLRQKHPDLDNHALVALAIQELGHRK